MISSFLVDHGPVRPALGYRVEFQGRAAVFSGDTRPSQNLVTHARGADVLVHEVVAIEAERAQALVNDPAVVWISSLCLTRPMYSPRKSPTLVGRASRCIPTSSPRRRARPISCRRRESTMTDLSPWAMTSCRF